MYPIWNQPEISDHDHDHESDFIELKPPFVNTPCAW